MLTCKNRRRNMLVTQGTLKRNLKLLLCCLIGCITFATFLIGRLIYYGAGKYYFHYYVLPSDIKIDTKKIIFLWTPIQGNYKEWSWGIGPDPIIADCNNTNIDGKCLITTHPNLLKDADVVLFSIQDIKQVWYYSWCTVTLIFIVTKFLKLLLNNLHYFWP